MAFASLLAISACCFSQISGSDLNDAGHAAVQCVTAGGECIAGPASKCAGLVLAVDDCKLENSAAPVCCLASTIEDAGPDAGADAGSDAGPDSGVVDSGFEIDAGMCGAASDLLSNATYPLSAWAHTSSADLNGDGLLDLVAGQFTPDAGFSVLFGQPDGTLSFPSFYEYSNFSALAVGDVNGDGSPDVVVADELSHVTVFLNDGGGGFSPEGPFPTTFFVVGIAIADLNRDGLPDLVLGEANNREGRAGTSSVEVLFGRPGGGFSNGTEVPGVQPNSAGALVVGDLNNDGWPDIVGNATDWAHLAVLLGQSDGGFHIALYKPIALGEIQFLPNGTPTPDIVLGESGGTPFGGNSAFGVTVLRNSGAGIFPDIRTYTVPGGAVVATGDFNGDCITDIATTAASFEGCQSGWAITVLYGDGDGGFGDPQMLIASGEGPAGIAALGQAKNPRAFGVTDLCGSGVTVYGQAGGD